MRQEKLFGLDELTQEVTSSALTALFANVYKRAEFPHADDMLFR